MSSALHHQNTACNPNKFSSVWHPSVQRTHLSAFLSDEWRCLCLCHLSRNELLVRVYIKTHPMMSPQTFQHVASREKTHTIQVMAAMKVTTQWCSIRYTCPLFKVVLQLTCSFTWRFSPFVFATHCPLIQRLCPVLQLESLLPILVPVSW